MTAVETQHCYRHPDRETGITYTRCDRPICPACMIAAAVGYQCPDCVRGGATAMRAARPRTLAGGTVTSDPRLVTKILIGINAAVFLAVGALLTAFLTVYLARAGVRRYWLCAVLAPVSAFVFYLAELLVLDGLLGSV